MKWMKGYLLLLLVTFIIVTGCSTKAQSKQQENVVVIVKEYSIGSGEIHLPQVEETVKVTIQNKGMNAHNFVIEEIELDSGMIRPGESVTMEINANEAASLHAKCTLPGHTEAGMTATIVIMK
jgi:uncharacterized cupredoxin-like copper-binding protein